MALHFDNFHSTIPSIDSPSVKESVISSELPPFTSITCLNRPIHSNASAIVDLNLYSYTMDDGVDGLPIHAYGPYRSLEDPVDQSAHLNSV